jgi:hypothetical protein
LIAIVQLYKPLKYVCFTTNFSPNELQFAGAGSVKLPHYGNHFNSISYLSNYQPGRAVGSYEKDERICQSFFTHHKKAQL